MKALSLKKTHILIIVSCLVIFVGWFSGSKTYACSSSVPCRPYFKAMGADVFVGGWFNNGNNPCSLATGSGTTYQDSFAASPPSPFVGAIMTYANEDASHNSAGGASSEYGAFALGGIASAYTQQGFYSGAALAAAGPTIKYYSSFGNSAPIRSFGTSYFSGSASWGGLYQDYTAAAHRYGHCIPDYYGTPSGGPLPSGQLDNNTPAGTYLQTPARGTIYSLNSAPVTISNNAHVTVFVNGSVYIGSNITYDRSNETIDRVPQFKLVVRGSIYVGGAVTQLDGVYVAQPDPNLDNGTQVNDNTTGVFWTCHDFNRPDPSGTWVYANCGNRLVVNGAVVAKEFILLRRPGDLATAATGPTSEDRKCRDDLGNQNFVAANTDCANIAEIFNYSPEVILGSDFNSTPGGGGSYQVDSLLNLPPIF